MPTIGDALSATHITWHYYGDGFSSQLLYSHYCDICNPFQYSRSIMTTDLKNNLVDLNSFFTDVQNNTLPAVSYVKPDDIVDGHPGTSTPAMFEAFIKNIVQTVKANQDVWDSTAILITTDESGGLYDSGYIQPIDFFGDGPRIMLLVVSKYAKTGVVDHTYADHASLLKFIEYNWSLQPLSATSRDNLPNPAPGPTPVHTGQQPGRRRSDHPIQLLKSSLPLPAHPPGRVHGLNKLGRRPLPMKFSPADQTSTGFAPVHQTPLKVSRT